MEALWSQFETLVILRQTYVYSNDVGHGEKGSEASSYLGRKFCVLYLQGLCEISCVNLQDQSDLHARSLQDGKSVQKLTSLSTHSNLGECYEQSP
jgi:hypothetical protein